MYILILKFLFSFNPISFHDFILSYFRYTYAINGKLPLWYWHFAWIKRRFYLGSANFESKYYICQQLIFLP